MLFSQEFPLADLETDGTLITVVITGVSYSEAVTRIKAWMNTWCIGPVLVTDDHTDEVLLPDFAPRRLRSGLSDRGSPSTARPRTAPRNPSRSISR